MPLSCRFSTRLFLVASSFALFPLHSAEAGFGWTPAPVVQQQPTVPALPPVPAISQQVLEAPLPPMPESDLPVPLGETTPESTGMKSLPSKFEPTLVKEALPSIPSPPALSSKSENILEGFGKDIPLAMALRDIVPAGYAFAFGRGDIAGKKISWRGGKPWGDVLRDALTPLNLTYSVQGNVVTVYAQGISAYPQPTSNSVGMVAQSPELTEPLARPTVEASVVPAPSYLPDRGGEVVASTYSSSAPVVDMQRETKWEARPGKTLRETLEQWCKESNVVLKWMTAYDYPVNNAFYFNGTYGEAVDLFSLLMAAKALPRKGGYTRTFRKGRRY